MSLSGGTDRYGPPTPGAPLAPAGTQAATSSTDLGTGTEPSVPRTERTPCVRTLRWRADRAQADERLGRGMGRGDGRWWDGTAGGEGGVTW